MKSLMLSLFAFVSINAFASDQLPENGGTISSVSATGYSTDALCPRGVTCITNGTILSLAFTGHGCLDQMFEPVYVVNGNDIYVHAQIVSPKENGAVRCMAIPVFQKQLQLIMKFPPFRVHFLGTNQTLTVN